jgi:hypothetical protein
LSGVWRTQSLFRSGVLGAALGWTFVASDVAGGGCARDFGRRCSPGRGDRRQPWARARGPVAERSTSPGRGGRGPPGIGPPPFFRPSGPPGLRVSC